MYKLFDDVEETSEHAHIYLITYSEKDGWLFSPRNDSNCFVLWFVDGVKFPDRAFSPLAWAIATQQDERVIQEILKSKIDNQDAKSALGWALFNFDTVMFRVLYEHGFCMNNVQEALWLYEERACKLGLWCEGLGKSIRNTVARVSHTGKNNRYKLFAHVEYEPEQELAYFVNYSEKFGEWFFIPMIKNDGIESCLK